MTQTRTYIIGQGRGNEGYDLCEETHIYEGTFQKPGYPLCLRGWNRDYGTAYSIFRGVEGKLGVCKVCEARAAKNLPGIGKKLSRKAKKRLRKRIDAYRVNPFTYTPLRPGLALNPPVECFDKPEPEEEDDYVYIEKVA